MLGSVAHFEGDRHIWHLLCVRGTIKKPPPRRLCGMVKGQAFIVGKREEIYPEASGSVQSREKSRLSMASRLAKARAGKAGEWKPTLETARGSIASHCIFPNEARLDARDFHAESTETIVMEPHPPQFSYLSADCWDLT